MRKPVFVYAKTIALISCDVTAAQLISAFVFIDTNFKLLDLCCSCTHYENTPMQYTAIFHGSKNDNFQIEKLIFFLFLLKT